MKSRANLSTNLPVLFCLVIFVFGLGDNLRGNVYLNLGNICFARAMVVEEYTQASRQEPVKGLGSCSEILERATALGIVAAGRNLGLARWTAGRLEQSLSIWQQRLQEDPADRLTHLWVGQALLPLDHDRALTHLKTAGSARYFMNLAKVEAEEEEGKDVADLVRLAVSIGDNNPADLYLEAAALLLQDDPESAIELVEQANQLKGDARNESHLMLGIAHYNLQNWNESIAALRAGLQEYPEDADSYYWLGLALWEKDGDRSLEEVVENLETALRLYPTRSDKAVLFALGDTYRSIGDHSRSVYWYEQLVRVASSTPGAFLRLSKAYISLGDWLMAERTLRDAIERWPGNVRFRFVMARTHLRLGEDRLACRQFGEALQLLPGDLDSYKYPSEVASALVELCDR